MVSAIESRWQGDPGRQVIYEIAATLLMFEIHADAMYAWVGLAVVSVVVFGVAATLPTTPPPDATRVAHTVDSVATGEYDATAEHGLTAEQIRITPQRIALASDGGTASATLRGAPITPIPPSATAGHARLRRVLAGVPPDQVFDDPAAFVDAAARAQAATHRWGPAPNRLTIRGVVYGGHRVTLVG